MNDVVLLSGGIDSTLCLWLASLRGPVMALCVDYGQHAAATEARISKMLAGRVGVSFRLLRVQEIAQFSHSALTQFGNASDPASTVVPGRNAMLLGFGAGFAQTIGAKRVWIGCNGDDAEVYADCRPQFIGLMSSALEGAYGCTVEAPLLGLSKKEVVKRAQSLVVPLAATSSCYLGTACGECHACKMRAAALA